MLNLTNITSVHLSPTLLFERVGREHKITFVGKELGTAVC